MDRKEGRLKLRLDSVDDLWTLRNLVQVGDLATADTYRTAEGADDKIRSEKSAKKRMRLGVRVQDVEWHDFADHLRIHGVIEAGAQDHGRHHTLVFKGEQEELEIQKPEGIQAWHLEQLKEAEAATGAAAAIVLSIDDSEAQLSVLRAYGIQHLGSIAATGQGKRHIDKDAKTQYYDEVVRALAALRRDHEPLLVVGPGWWRTEFIEYAAKQHGLVDGAQSEGTGQAGRAGVQEAISRGLVERIAQEGRVGNEAAKVEEVFIRMATDGLVAYGPAEVRDAVDVGAAEELLIADTAARSGDHDELLKAADMARCKVHVVATGHDAGARLAAIGGVAALLRFKT